MTQIIYSLCWYLGGYGILNTHAALLLILPQKPQNSQKFLAEKSLPQMHTDEHRLGVPAGGVGMAGCHTLLQKLPQIALPRNNNNIATQQQQYCHATTTRLPRYNNKTATLR
ncbi:hypothetical protein [Leyella stercorea]